MSAEYEIVLKTTDLVYNFDPIHLYKHTHQYRLEEILSIEHVPINVTQHVYQFYLEQLDDMKL